MYLFCARFIKVLWYSKKSPLIIKAKNRNRQLIYFGRNLLYRDNTEYWNEEIVTYKTMNKELFRVIAQGAADFIGEGLRLEENSSQVHESSYLHLAEIIRRGFITVESQDAANTALYKVFLALKIMAKLMQKVEFEVAKFEPNHRFIIHSARRSGIFLALFGLLTV